MSSLNVEKDSASISSKKVSSVKNNSVSSKMNKKNDNYEDKSNNSDTLIVNFKTMDLSEKEIHDDHYDPDDEEDEEHHLDLTDKQLIFKAIRYIIYGTIFCGVFSEPLVGVINEFSTKIDISPFYVSFVVSPIALNMREVIASFSYAKKKTTNSISLLLASFNGTATMNNTLALAIFLGIIFFRELPWSFTAEVIVAILVIIIVGLNSLPRTIKLWQAFLVASLYPLSILLVYILKSKFGLD